MLRFRTKVDPSMRVERYVCGREGARGAALVRDVVDGTTRWLRMSVLNRRGQAMGDVDDEDNGEVRVGSPYV